MLQCLIRSTVNMNTILEWQIICIKILADTSRQITQITKFKVNQIFNA